MYYCSKECQVLDWKNCHKYECNQMKSLVGRKSPLMATDCVLMACFRVCYKTQFDKEVLEKKWKLTDGRERNIEDLVDHLEDIKKQPDRIMGLIQFAREMTQLAIGFDFHTVLRRCGQVLMNGYLINDHLSLGTKAAAMGLYVDASNFKHSCRPNAQRMFDGRTHWKFAR